MKEQPENQNEKSEPPELPRHIARITEELRNKESGHREWLESQAKTPSKYIR